MKLDFMVISLPRSRSAWLANFLTTDKSLCLHDPFGPWIARQEPFPHSNFIFGNRLAGAADTAICWLDAVNGWEFANANRVVIERDPRDVFHSLQLLGLEEATPSLPTVRNQADMLAKVKNALRVPFEQIDERLGEIWAHCLPSLPFDEARADLLRGFNIELTPAMLRTAVAKEAA